MSLRFAVSAPGIKLHICQSMEVAEAVEKDLDDRFPELQMDLRFETLQDTDSIPNSHVDAGGSIMASMKPVEIEIDGISFSFYAHQANWARSRVKKALDNPRIGGYVKIHTAFNAICLK